MARPEKRTSGRTTPKKESAAPGRAPREGTGGAKPLPQVGKRPSNPGKLALISLSWIACGVIALVKLTASWKLVPGIVFIGIGFFFLRAALTTVVRHTDRSD